MKYGALLLLVTGLNTFADVTTETVLPNATYTVDASGVSIFNLNFTRTAAQLTSDYKYRLIIKNADGAPHVQQSCKGLGPVAKAICKTENAANKYYVNTYRTNKLHLRVNGVALVNNSNFGPHTSVLELNLTNIVASNSIHFKIKDLPGAYIQLAVVADVTNFDRVAPSLMSSLASNSLVRLPALHISVTDVSATSTEVILNGISQGITASKQIDLTLAEGANNLVIHSQDSHGNISPDLILSNIILDSTLPVISTSSANNFYFSQLPTAFNITFRSNESLSLFKINGQAVVYSALDGGYSFDIPVTAAGPLSIAYEATDLAGNILQGSFSVNAILDNIPPEISITPPPAVIVAASYLLSVGITDVNSTSTKIIIDGIESAPTFEKNFSYLIEFAGDQTKSITVSSTDGAGNNSTKNVKIKRDTSPLLVQFLSPLPNTTIGTRVFEVEISGSRPLANINLNGQDYPVANQALSRKILVQVTSDDDFHFTVNATDIFGFTGSTTVDFKVKSTSISSWDYRECTAE